MSEAQTMPAEPPPEADPRPIVARPRAGLPGAAIAAGAIVLALLLFFILDARRRAAQSTTRTTQVERNAFVPPDPLVVPPLPLDPAPLSSPPPPMLLPPRPQPVFPAAPLPRPSDPLPAFMPSQPPPAMAPVLPPERRTPTAAGPALVIDAGVQTGAAGSGANPAEQNAVRGGFRQNGAGAGIGGDDAPARAAVIGNRTTIMPAGTLIPAVLETPIDSARPGLVRALVSADTAGFDGSRILVPRGSRLIGEYQSDVRSGQNRVLVTWTRLIRPDGVAIRLGSPAADALGGAGVPGRVNTFFFQRFASAVLQSALTVGVNLASRPGSGSVIVGVPSSAANVVGQSLLPGNDLRPKITVKQGASLNVFVARDLDFSGVPALP